MDLVSLSSNLLYTAFILYLIATIFFGATIRDKRSKTNNKEIAGKIGITIAILGFLAQLGYFITRWMASGHAPLGNMFEFVTFLGMAMVLGFIIIYFIYRIGFLGVFALPLAMIIIAYASMFPTQLAPLVPTLNTNWLYIHVSTVAIGQGILFISFVAGLMFLIKTIDQKKRTKKNMWLELILYTIFLFIGFIVISTTFKIVDYQVTFEYQVGTQSIETNYKLPPIASPNNSELLTEDVMEPWFEVPEWMQGADAGRKFNTVIWSIITGTIIYGLTILICRKRVGAALQPLLRNVKADLLDEIMYRAVTIGFPIFTLGGLIFASIWAQIAWGRFWGWDPKEVWALITWFFYAAFLHLRLSRGWHGEKSGWLAVIGFAIIMFNLIVVNLVLAGLHSYA